MNSQSPDMVNSPSHYQLDGMEAIDIIKAALTPEEYRGYLKGNALKYMLREPFKGNPAQDVAKAEWYLSRYHGKIADGDTLESVKPQCIYDSVGEDDE